MSRPHFTICIEKKNHFNRIFIPFSKEIKRLLERLECTTDIVWGDKATSNRKIIFGSHANPEYWLQHSKQNDIIVNLEPVYKKSWKIAHGNYIRLLQSRLVFDYFSLNSSFIPTSAVFKIPPFFQNYKPVRKKEFDAVFIGSRNDYRNKILQKLSDSKIRTGVGFDLFDQQTFQAIDSAILYINLDLDEESVFNGYRFADCALSKTLFAGHSGCTSNCPEVGELLGISIFKTDEELFSGLNRLLSDKSLQKKASKIQKLIALDYQKQFLETLRKNLL